MSQQCKSSQTESAGIATSKRIKVTTVSLLRDVKLMSRDKSVDLTGVYHVVRHYLNVCDIIFSTYDKFLACDVTSLIC